MVFVILSRIRITGKQLDDPPVPVPAEVGSVLPQCSVVAVNIRQRHTVWQHGLLLDVAQFGFARGVHEPFDIFPGERSGHQARVTCVDKGNYRTNIPMPRRSSAELFGLLPLTQSDEVSSFWHPTLVPHPSVDRVLEAIVRQVAEVSGKQRERRAVSGEISGGRRPIPQAKLSNQCLDLRRHARRRARPGL